ncbi:MAG TPA: hypothetical protein VFP50_15520 [Anaeromyxobacteraceae bacterium]|nr:hypothetical protein [Anaeromyxobacteraceae bacterium]
MSTETEALQQLQTFAADLERRQLDGRLKRRASLWKPTATSATQLGYECERRIVYQRVLPWAAEPISAELASIFEEGNYHERQVLRELEEDLGIPLRERNATFRDADLELVGQLDAEAKVPALGWVPVEVKGLAFIPGDDVEGADLADGPVALHRRYFAQLQVYLFLRGKPAGLLLFKSKATGRWRVVPVALDYERTEVLLRRAERVRDAVRAYIAAFATVMPYTQDGPDHDEAGVSIITAGRRAGMLTAEPHLPARIPDRSECGSCPFRRTCNPSEAPVDPALLVDDQALITDLVVMAEAKPHRLVYEKKYKAVRNRFALTGGSVFFAGPFKVEKKPHGSSWRLDITNQEEAHRGPADPE